MSQWHGGKGDKSRTTDNNKYRNNYDLIDWSKGKDTKKPVESNNKPVTQEVYHGS